MKAQIPEWMRNKKQPLKKCSGCGKEVNSINSTRYYLSVGAYVGGTPDELRFCTNCMNHIRRGGAMFFTTYSFE